MATTYKVNKTELKGTPWGDVDKTALRNKVMKASNRDSLVKDVYALVEADWENSPSEHLKYPIMRPWANLRYIAIHFIIIEVHWLLLWVMQRKKMKLKL